MAKQKQQDLFDVLRASGLRKKVARGLSRSAGNAGPKRSKALSASAEHLRSVASSIDKRAVNPKRSAAAKKAAQTRKRNAAKRSAAAKKGARTRAKSK
jgi:DNA topoisomerase I